MDKKLLVIGYWLKDERPTSNHAKAWSLRSSNYFKIE
jgi:hypothetical protein